VSPQRLRGHERNGGGNIGRNGADLWAGCCGIVGSGRRPATVGSRGRYIPAGIWDIAVLLGNLLVEQEETALT